MSEHPSQKHSSSFIQKLYLMVQNQELSSALRWNSKGTGISIISVSHLQEHVLPLYFRHSKYASFVRQLNIYGFAKSKNQKGSISCFSHPYFVKGSKDFQKINKKCRKINSPVQGEVNRPVLQQNLANNQKNSHFTNHRSETEQLLLAPSNQMKIAQLKNHQLLNSHEVVSIPSYRKDLQICSSYSQKKQTTPRIVDLLEQLQSKIQNISEDLEILRYVQMEQILRQSRYEKVKHLYQTTQISSEQNISIFSQNYDLGMQFQQMEFII